MLSPGTMVVRRLLVPAILAAAGAGAEAAGAADAETRPERGPVCGTGPELQALLIARTRDSLRKGLSREEMALQAAGDFDIGNIAILKDDGRLVGGGPPLRTDTAEIVRQFYLSHPDDYDQVIVFTATNFPCEVEAEAGFAFYQPVSNDVLGIGMGTFNQGGSFGLPTTRLRGFVNMNDLPEYGKHPDSRIPFFVSRVSGPDILGQEAMHMVGAFVNVDPSIGNLLGRGNAHWSFFMQTYASVMEGNGWSQTDSATFTSVESFRHYSQLDEYLFGFRPPSEVTEPMFVINLPTNTGGRTAASTPEPGVTINGVRSDFTIGDVIARNGARAPDATSEDHTVRAAFVLVIPPGTTEPLPSDLQKISRFRRYWTSYFNRETEGLGLQDTTLPAPGNTVIADFTADLVAGGVPFAVRFGDRTLGDPTGYGWDFGDGGSSAEAEPVHTYTTPGVYTVTLTVTGAGGPSIKRRRNFIVAGGFGAVFQDDLEIDRGWTPGTPETVTSGVWTRVDPVGTFVGAIFQDAPVQPESCTTPGGSLCLVTGQGTAGGAPSDADVDGGSTTIVSPVIDLAGAVFPILQFNQWWSSHLGACPSEDAFQADVSFDGGGTWIPMRSDVEGDVVWTTVQIRLAEYGTPTATTRFRFTASDLEGGSLIEAGLDDVSVKVLTGFPDADGDAVPDAADDCPADANTMQADLDADGAGDACDCAPADPSASRPPGAVPAGTLIFHDEFLLSWGAAPAATSHNVYRGVRSSGSTPFSFDSLACHEPASPDLFSSDPATPAPGELFVYLVSGRNACGESGLGLDGNGDPRPAPPAPCP
jgi:PKD repeat protein